jgi:hypothetical protein
MVLVLAVVIVLTVAALVAFIVWKSPALKHVKFTAVLLKLITLSFEFDSHPPDSKRPSPRKRAGSRT